VLDSGCANYMTGEKEMLTYFEENDCPSDTITFGDNSQGKVLRCVLVVLKPNRIIRKQTDANCSSFHLRVFLVLSNPQGQRQTSTLSIQHDNFGERKRKFNLGMSGQLKCNCINTYTYHRFWDCLEG
jgi:hypothetical protein